MHREHGFALWATLFVFQPSVSKSTSTCNRKEGRRMIHVQKRAQIEADGQEIGATPARSRLLKIWRPARMRSIFSTAGHGGGCAGGAGSVEKAHIREPCVVRVGVEVDGIAGILSVPKLKMRRLDGCPCVCFLDRFCLPPWSWCS